MKRIVAGMLCVCILVCHLCVVPEKRARAENSDISYRSGTVNGKIYARKTKAVSDAAYIGYFCDAVEETAKEVELSIIKKGKKYEAVYSQLRLCTIDKLKGTVKNGILTLKGLDPAGKPITLTVSKEGRKRVLTFKKTTWEYFTQGAAITLKRGKRKGGLSLL